MGLLTNLLGSILDLGTLRCVAASALVILFADIFSWLISWLGDDKNSSINFYFVHIIVRVGGTKISGPVPEEIGVPVVNIWEDMGEPLEV